MYRMVLNIEYKYSEMHVNALHPISYPNWILGPANRYLEEAAVRLMRTQSYPAQSGLRELVHRIALQL